jgi:VWFA-related protein
VLLLDVSGSVAPVFEQIQDGALRALQHLKEEDEVALMAFDTEAVLIEDFTRDRQLIANRMAKEGEMLVSMGPKRRMPPDGTHIADSIYLASRHLLKASNPAGRRVIIVVTDDQPVESWTLHSKQEVRNDLFETGAVVYGLLTDTAKTPAVDKVADAIAKYYPPVWIGRKLKLFRDTSRNIGGKVDTYAEPTGGAVIDARKQKFETKLTELVEILRNRYSLGYYPSNREFDGKFHQIKLKVSPEVEKLEGKLVITTRRGYIRRGCPGMQETTRQ